MRSAVADYSSMIIVHAVFMSTRGLWVSQLPKVIERCTIVDRACFPVNVLQWPYKFAPGRTLQP